MGTKKTIATKVFDEYIMTIKALKPDKCSSIKGILMAIASLVTSFDFSWNVV